MILVLGKETQGKRENNETNSGKEQLRTSGKK